MNRTFERAWVAACFILAAVFLFWHARSKSPAYDEVSHIQAGYYYWQHLDFSRGLEHPTLMRLLAAAPLQTLGIPDPEDHVPAFQRKPLTDYLEYLYGTLLVYRNPAATADRVMILARSAILIFPLLLFALVYAWTRDLYGPAAACASLFLMATTAPFLAHGTFVMTDVAGTTGAALAAYAAFRYRRDPSHAQLVLFGVSLGVAQLCKLSNIFLIPLAAPAVLWPSERGLAWKTRAAHLALAYAICALVINLGYGFQDFLPPHHIHPRDLEAYGWPAPVQWIYRWLPLPDFYLISLGFMSYHASRAFLSSYLLGRIYPEGTPLYFPALFLLKTSVAGLAALGLTLASLRRVRWKREEWLLLVPLAAYVVLALRAKLNLGIRHFLLVYPFLWILAGRVFQELLQTRRGRVFAAALAAVQLFELARVAPHFMGFYNALVGGPRAGLRYSADADLGQELKALGEWKRRHPKAELVLSYFGTGLPGYYGIDAQELIPTGTKIHNERVNSERPEQEFLAVSLVHLHGLNVGPGTFDWLKERKPEAVLGYAMLIYDITRDADAHELLAEIYARAGEFKKAERHRKRALNLMEKRSAIRS